MDEVSSVENLDENNLIKTAKSFVEQERWQDAVELLNPHYEEKKLSIEGQKILAHSHSREKNFNAAADIYELLCEKMPHESVFHYYLAYQYQMLKKWKQAATSYEKCLDLFPQFIKAYLQLGGIYEELDSKDDAISVYRKGFKIYRKLVPIKKKAFAPICARILAGAAKLLLSSENKTENTLSKIEFCLKESVACDPYNADNLYRLGKFLLEVDRVEDGIKILDKAHSIAPKKEYISHKIAQAFLMKGESERAYEIYENVPVHKRSAYILNGMAKCLLKQDKLQDSARLLFRATRLESKKFYHFRDLGNVLIKLGDRDQAIEVLEIANDLFKKEHGNDHNTIISAIEEAKKLSEGHKLIFEDPSSSVAKISYGIIKRYLSERGFGFISDDNDGDALFFHIKCVKSRIEPKEGMRVRFLRDIGEKGPYASKVWINDKDQKK